jgi:hypothetical protein
MTEVADASQSATDAAGNGSDAASLAAEAAKGNGAAAETVEKPIWLEQLPQEMRGDTSLYGFKSIKDVVEAYKSKSESLTVPGENATADEWAAYNKAFGIPETADGYQLTKPANIPDEFYSPEMAKAFADAAHANGITTISAHGLFKWWNGVQAQAIAAGAQAQEASKAALQTEWGNDFTANAEIAKRAFEKFGGPDVAKLLTEARIGAMALGDDPRFMRLFHGIGKAIMPDSAALGGEAGLPAQENKTASQIAKEKYPNMRGEGD